MQFIAKHTSIPVPKVYCAFQSNGTKYILMERLPGTMLRNGWLDRSPESKAKILAQLRDMIEQMRRIPCPAGQGVSNVAGGPLFEGRLAGGSYHGPFDDVHAFHRYLCEGYDGGREDARDADMLVDWHRKQTNSPRFTHGDLSSLNILAEGDKVTGIIDWETSGWWPEYWEYTSAWHVNPYNEFWQEEVDKFLEPNQTALEMEKIRRKYWADIT